MAGSELNLPPKQDNLDRRSSTDLEKGDAFEDRSDAGQNQLHTSTPPSLGDMHDLQLDEKPSPTRQNINPMDWNGPDDPDNPHNWNNWKRFYHVLMPGLFGFAVYVPNL